MNTKEEFQIVKVAENAVLTKNTEKIFETVVVAESDGITITAEEVSGKTAMSVAENVIGDLMTDPKEIIVSHENMEVAIHLETVIIVIKKNPMLSVALIKKQIFQLYPVVKFKLKIFAQNLEDRGVKLIHIAMKETDKATNIVEHTMMIREILNKSLCVR